MFTLYEVRDKEVEYIKSITSDAFQVHPAKNWPGMAESTFLTRSFSDQGVRLRLRKEPRFRLGPRGPASDDYQPRHYNTNRRRQSQLDNIITGSQEPSSASVQPQEIFDNVSRQVLQDNYGNSGRQGANEHIIHSASSHSSTFSQDKKREFSQSSQSGSFASHPDEPIMKRSRQEFDSLQPQYGNQTTYSPQNIYPQRTFPDNFQGQQQFQQMYSQPNQQQQHQQLYSPNYISSPQGRLGREGYFSPRGRDSFSGGGNTSPYESSPGSRLPSTTQFQRSPAPVSYQYPVQQNYGMQPLQPVSYTPQLVQPVPPSRTQSNLSMYTNAEIDPALTAAPRTHGIMTNEMPPPMYSRTAAMPIMQQGIPQMPTYTTGRIPSPMIGDIYRDYDPQRLGDEKLRRG
jgi:hypothetical protein